MHKIAIKHQLPKRDVHDSISRQIKRFFFNEPGDVIEGIEGIEGVEDERVYTEYPFSIYA